jgi:ABC-2 type transport system ATP-binding protein
VADALVLRNLNKSFGSKDAVRDLDLTIPQGGLYGIIGPNGAGKTTTIRIIMAILFPDRGDVEVLGHKSALEAKDRIGYLPEERGVYKKMKVGAFLNYIGKLKGDHRPDLSQRVHRWLERVGLAEVEHKRCEELSKGMQQKIQYVAAVLHEPDLLILDEPFSGLDPVNMRLLRELVLEQHQRGATVLFSTHVMTQAEQICDHIVMIHDGRKVLDESMARIRGSQTARSLWFEPMHPGADVSPLRRIAGVTEVARRDGAHEIVFAPGSDPAAILHAAVEAVPAARVELRRPSLEDVFIGIVQSSNGGAEADTGRLRDALRDPAASLGGSSP